jgi:hypothetical protein
MTVLVTLTLAGADDGQYILAGTCNYSSNNTNELWRV